ncbi:MAG: hypothetical protein KM296_03350 [Brockia lithotrophica]|nr:hypothetical protein [Brockia lithotrophica]
MQPRFALYVFLSTYFMAGFGFVPRLLLAPPRGGDGLALAAGSLLGVVLALAYGTLWRKAPYTPLHDQLTTVLPPAAARSLAAAFGLTYLTWGSLAILFSADVAIRFLGAPALLSLPVFLFAALALYGSRLPFSKLLLAVEVLALLGILVLLLSLPPTLAQPHTRWDLAWRHLLRPGVPAYGQIAAAFVPFSGTLALAGFLHVLEPPKRLFPYALVFLFLAVAYVFLYLLPLSLLGPELLARAPHPWLSAASAVRLYLSPMEQDFLTLVLVTLTSASLAATVFWAASLRLFETALFGESAKRKGARGTTPELDTPVFLGMRPQRFFPWLFLAVSGLFLLPLLWNLLGTEGTYRAAAAFFAVLPAIELAALVVFGLFVRLSPQKRPSQGPRRGFRGGKAALVALFLGGSAAFAAGCNYRDIEQHAFVIAVGIDGPAAEGEKSEPDRKIPPASEKDHEGPPATGEKAPEAKKKRREDLRFTFKVVIPSPEIKKGENRFLLLETEASGFAEAVENLRARSSSSLDFSHLNIVVIGEDAFLDRTLGELLDGFFRREEIKVTAIVAVGRPTARDVLRIKPPDERIPGSNLLSLLERTGEDNPALYPAELFDVGRRLLEPDFDPVLPVVTAREQGYRIDSLYVCDKTRPRLELRGEEAVLLNALLRERIPLSVRADDALLVSPPGRWRAELRVEDKTTLHLRIWADAAVEENPDGTPKPELEARAGKALAETARIVLQKIAEEGFNPYGLPRPRTTPSPEPAGSALRFRDIRVDASVRIVDRGSLEVKTNR